MKKILMTAVCVGALAVPAMAQTGGTPPTTKSDTRMDNSRTGPPDASKGTSTDAKKGIPGNPTAGGDGSQSNPKSNAPGASKSGGG